MADLGVSWANLSPQDRLPYATALLEAELPEVPIAAPPTGSEFPWPHVGDDFYPVKVVDMEGVPKMVTSLAERWLDTVGHDIPQPVSEQMPAPSKTCPEIWGLGCCEQDMDAQAREQLSRCKARLSLWSDITRRKDAKFDSFWETLPLFFIGCAVGAQAQGAADDPRGLAMLLIFAEFQPKRQLFITNKCSAPVLGDIMHFTALAMDDFMCMRWPGGTAAHTRIAST
jgi:hypothetical protein